MSTDAAPPNGSDPDPVHHLRHGLKTPLCVVLARAQLLARGVRGSPSLGDEERAKMLHGLATIEASVHTMVTLIDGKDGPGDNGRREPD